MNWRDQIVRATLESVAYQTRDLLEAMRADSGALADLRVDGGMVANHWLMGFLADLIGETVSIPEITETTALGAAFLAALQCGVIDDLGQISNYWREQKRMPAGKDREQANERYRKWQEAVARVRTS